MFKLIIAIIVRWIKGTYLSEKYILNNCVVHGHEKRINHVTCVVIEKIIEQKKMDFENYIQFMFRSK